MTGTPREKIHEPLFVYGTLRRGADQHDLLDGATAIGEATWPGRLFGVAHYPGAVLSSDPRDSVRGEVYALAPTSASQLLARLDRYEGPEFRRERTNVRLGDGTRVESWIYLYVAPVDGLRRIGSGDFLKPGA